MATSGTIATTVIDTAKLLEHATRRVGLASAIQTPELVEAAQESLYLFLLSLSNHGLNLWCVEKVLLGLGSGQATYALPAGTLDLASDPAYSQPTRVTGTDSSTATSFTTQLASATRVYRVGIKLSAATTTNTLTLQHSPDGVAWTTALTESRTDWSTGTWYWYDLDPSAEDLYFRANFTSAITAGEFYLASAINDLPLSQWNRDTYIALNNKSAMGSPATCYLFEKRITPQITLWPVPNNNYDHLSVWRHRQIEDIGTLTQQVEVPQRWLEGVIWHAAVRIGSELPGVDPKRLDFAVKMADKYTFEAEWEETDGSRTNFDPGIGVYTR